MRDSDSHNTSSRSAHASRNGRTVHGPQPRPGEAEAIRCRRIGQDRARNGEDRGARMSHWAGSPRVGTFAVVACARNKRSSAPDMSDGNHARIARVRAGMARQCRSDRCPDVAGLSARKRCDGRQSAEPAARPAVSQPASTTNDQKELQQVSNEETTRSRAHRRWRSGPPRRPARRRARRPPRRLARRLPRRRPDARPPRRALARPPDARPAQRRRPARKKKAAAPKKAAAKKKAGAKKAGAEEGAQGRRPQEEGRRCADAGNAGRRLWRVDELSCEQG